METRSGFTLIQLFVVIILCVLWVFITILIPKFTEVSTDSGGGGALGSDLQAVRSQVQLFKIHHNDILPGSALLTGGATFIQCMTGTTDQYGDPLGTDYGPYMGRIPANPFSTLALDAAGNGTVDETGTVGDDGGHWEWNSTTGEFSADDSWDQDGVAGPDHADL